MSSFLRRISLLSISILLTLLFTQSFSGSLDKREDIHKAYESENSIERKDAVKAAGQFNEDWSKTLIEDALTDHSYLVVEAAIEQIGNAKIKHLSDDLIYIYEKSDRLYKDYAKRIRYSIIPALANIGGKEATTFLIELLKNDEGTHLGEPILKAIKKIGDKNLVAPVKEYSKKLKDSANNSSDPLTQSRKLAYIELASEVERTLNTETN